jgi:hypothetical protein
LNEAINQLAEKSLELKQAELGRRIPHDAYARELQKVRMSLADRYAFGVESTTALRTASHASTCASCWSNFEPTEVWEAWRPRSRDLRFGFEFIARATFRDVNFGEVGKPGVSFEAANRDSPRPGFTLCRHCGKVQTGLRQADDEPTRTDACL